MKDLQPHAFAELMPPMSAEDFSALKTDIEANGQQDDIVLYQGKILDGRNRYEVMKGLKIKPRFTTFKGTDAEAVAFVRSRHTRRNLTTSQRLWAACKFYPHYQAEAAARKSANGGSKADVPKSARPADCQNDAAMGKARDAAGAAFGISGATVGDGLKLLRDRPDLFPMLATGEKTLGELKRMVQADHKHKHLAAMAQLAPDTGDAEIITGDCMEKMEAMPARKFRLIFTDPQYNIGLDYKNGKGRKGDRLPPEVYLANVAAWVAECHRLLTDDGTLWVMISDEWADEYSLILKRNLFTRRAWVKWYETFGQNQADNFNRTSRHLFYCVKDPDQFVFNREAFHRLSDRQTKYGDKRAAAGGKLWDDVWTIPRLVANDREVVPGFTSQLPLALVEPIVRGCSEPGDSVFDPFTGSGTTAIAAIRNGRKFVGTEDDKKRAEMARVRVRAELAKKAG